jgi:hypothetical protein
MLTEKSRIKSVSQNTYRERDEERGEMLTEIKRADARGSQRDVVYLSIYLSYISPNAACMLGEGLGVACKVSANECSCAHGAQMNFEDLTPMAGAKAWGRF